MSAATAEEDPELRDLVAQTLENNGVLSKIRAQLRASVFLALEDQDLVPNKIPFVNKSLKEFLKTSEGSLVACLVREFLEFFELDFTLSVFDPETYHGKDYDYGGRNQLIKDLQLKNLNGKKGPLLAQILQLVQVPAKDNSGQISKEELNKASATKGEGITTSLHSAPKSLNAIDTKLVNLWDSPVPDNEVTTIPINNSVTNKSIVKSDGTEGATKHTLIETPIDKTPADETKTKYPGKKAEPKGSQKSLLDTTPPDTSHHSALTSLGNLPPLMGSGRLINTDNLSFSTHGEKDMSQIKALMNGLDASDNNYEEDFNSSASGSILDGKNDKNSTPASDSDEIEEDIVSGIDDLLSNASGLDELTVDISISNVSGLGDYMENL